MFTCFFSPRVKQQDQQQMNVCSLNSPEHFYLTIQKKQQLILIIFFHYKHLPGQIKPISGPTLAWRLHFNQPWYTLISQCRWEEIRKIDTWAKFICWWKLRDTTESSRTFTGWMKINGNTCRLGKYWYFGLKVDRFSALSAPDKRSKLKMCYFGTDAASAHTMSHLQQYLIGNTSQLIPDKHWIMWSCKETSNQSYQINVVNVAENGKYSEVPQNCI